MGMELKEFFVRQETTAREIRQQLEKEHALRAKTARRSASHTFRVGDPVWALRPQPMGIHRTKTWFTPEEVVRKIDEDTYCIKAGPGQFREQQESELHPREPDSRGKHVSLHYTADEADLDDNYAEQADYTVEKILAKHPSASAPGGVEFKVRWRGHAPSHDTWETVSSFVPRINTPFIKYIRRHKTKIQVSDLEALTRAIEARDELIPALSSPLSEQIRHRSVRLSVRPLLACCLVRCLSRGVVEMLRKSTSPLIGWLTQPLRVAQTPA